MTEAIGNNNVIAYSREQDETTGKLKTEFDLDQQSVDYLEKHLGAAMSSRLTPPNDPSRRATVSTIVSTSFDFMQRGNASTPPNLLNRTHLPSITGIPASGPMSPSPRTAVPSVTTATRFERLVYLYERSTLSFISRHGCATPGV